MRWPPGALEVTCDYDFSWLDDYSIDDIYNVQLSGVSRLPPQQAKPAFFAALALGYRHLARDGTTAAGARGAKYRAVARAAILGRPIGAPKPTPATVTDRATSVANGHLQSLWEGLLEAVAAAPPPPDAPPRRPCPPPPATPPPTRLTMATTPTA